MTTILLILLKFSLNITGIWVFYKLFLEKLTFFNSNRFFFLITIFFAFFLAVGHFNWIGVLFNQHFGTTDLGQYVPSVQTSGQHFFNPITKLIVLSPIFLIIYFSGITAFSIHQAIQYLSYLKLKRNAYIKEVCGLKVYVVHHDILPFSFGKSIFISESALTNSEITKILLHESIHIQQNHSLDVLLAEFIRIVNWVNPFAWFLKNSVRDNLEFLTDALVIGKGIDKKSYQYLLLHFSGNNYFSLVTNFNFYSLKTRISKMNQNKSNQLQYSRFLLFIPLILVLMFVFSCMNDQTTEIPPELKKMDEAITLKLKSDLRDPEIEFDSPTQLQLKKIDETELVQFKSKLSREFVLMPDGQAQKRLMKKEGAKEVEFIATKLVLDKPAQDQPKQTLLLQKVKKSSQGATEQLPPPPPPPVPTKE
ncbi:M56 family metallopeptidase [Emticicia sp. BO119]|uniref:M56 family metallopeptidase n=1 Tax=Emticicia sp. BO119 TaxID=2757768 RepID=UPI0015F01DF5|nr:M56 family metallopeptidase [Emticicia sp. BO119]MBA4849571.1 M56 family metallopeptidase [Emticicia sp. BO119]